MLLATLSIGTIPSEFPLVDVMGAPLDRTLEMLTPRPPPYLEMRALSWKQSKIPSNESSMDNKKQLAHCWTFMPALNRVGEACVNFFLDIKS